MKTFECPGGTKRTNEYRAGSLAWIERNAALEFRSICEALISGEITTAAAEEWLFAIDTDSLAAFVPPGHSKGEAAS